VKSLEDMKAAADRASDREDFASAGRTYNVLLENYSLFDRLMRALSFDAGHLNEKLSRCRKSFSALGVQEYRKGNLGEANAAARARLHTLWQRYKRRWRSDYEADAHKMEGWRCAGLCECSAVESWGTGCGTDGNHWR